MRRVQKVRKQKYLVCLNAPCGFLGYYVKSYRYQNGETFENYRDSLSPDQITSCEVEATTKQEAEAIALKHFIHSK